MSWKKGSETAYQDAFDTSAIDDVNIKIAAFDAEEISQCVMDDLVNDLNRLLLDPAKSIGICKKAHSFNNVCRRNAHSGKSDKPWFDKACEIRRKEYFKEKHRLQKVNSVDSKLEFRKLAKTYKRFIRAKMRAYNKEFHNSLRNLRNSNPKKYWKLLDDACILPEKGSNIPLNAFMSHFKNLSMKPEDLNSHESDFDPSVIDHSINEAINKNFTYDEVILIIRKLRNNKACGIDNVINEQLKNCPDSVVNLLVRFFNIVLSSGVVPSVWCLGMIKPLFKKKGSADDPDNYRGITLLSCVGKLFTACINARLSLYLECAGILGSEQAGFRDGHSTLDHIFTLHGLIDLYLNDRKRIYCAFVDYKKAFDLVDRSSLWSKLISSGINGKIINVVYNMYKNAKSCVKLGNNLSEFFVCNIGVRQGENLSPLLFALYLNDFEYFVSRHYKGLDMCSSAIREHLSDDDVEVFLRLYVLLYADDTVIFAESAEELQCALAAVHQYCDLWKLTVNTSKTKVVIFSRGRVRRFPQFMFGDSSLDVVSDYTYLGVIFNYNGSFNKAMKKQINQARRAMFHLKSKARKLSLPIDVQCELFDVLVAPILLYGSEVWGYENLECIEMFYKKFLKSLLGLKRGTANCMVFGELGRLGLTYNIEKRMVNFWLRLNGNVHGRSKLSCIIYNLLRQLNDKEIFKSKWIVKVKDILDKCGMSNLWSNRDVTFNPKWVKSAVSLRLNDIGQQNWSAEVNRNRLCTNYRIFKEKYIFEEYLIKLNYSEWLALCRFRCGNHRLPVSEGRYLLNQEVKLCTLCNLNDPGDEFHFLFKCPIFETDRKVFISAYYARRPNVLKMKQLFNSTNMRVLKKLSRFCQIIMARF